MQCEIFDLIGNQDVVVSYIRGIGFGLSHYPMASDANYYLHLNLNLYRKVSLFNIG